MDLKKIIAEEIARAMIEQPIITEDQRAEEISMYIDIISMDVHNPIYDKYKEELKTKYNVDWKDYIKDEYYIHHATLDDIKSKSDFLNFDRYVEYAYKIFQLRKLATKQPKQKKTNMITIEDAAHLGKVLGFKVKHRPYTGSGNYAQVRHADTGIIEMPEIIDGGMFIHELGHIYDHAHYKKGPSRIITNASSPYQIKYTDEVFAENFMHFFLAPKFLKNNLPEVYNDLNKRIKSKWKKEIQKILS